MLEGDAGNDTDRRVAPATTRWMAAYVDAMTGGAGDDTYALDRTGKTFDTIVEVPVAHHTVQSALPRPAMSWAPTWKIWRSSPAA
jgi:hypothetical protein